MTQDYQERHRARVLELRRQTDELDRAIADAPCEYCGAKSGEPCEQKPKSGFWRARVTTRVPHIARVKAGHALLRVRAESAK